MSKTAENFIKTATAIIGLFGSIMIGVQFVTVSKTESREIAKEEVHRAIDTTKINLRYEMQIQSRDIKDYIRRENDTLKMLLRGEIE